MVGDAYATQITKHCYRVDHSDNSVRSHSRRASESVRFSTAQEGPQFRICGQMRGGVASACNRSRLL